MHKVLRFASIRQHEITRALASYDLEWQQVTHITATPSLQRAINGTGAHALVISAVMRLVLDQHPTSAQAFAQIPHINERTFGDAFNAWQSQNRQREIATNLLVSDTLLELIRRDQDHKPFVRAFYESRATLRTTMQTLIDCGYTPDDVDATDSITRWAVDAWRLLEERIPSFARHRELLWGKWQDGASTQEIQDNIAAVLDILVGHLERKVIVFHGFYRYPPKEWALMQWLMEWPDLEVIFIMHDDGTNPVFGSWRHFYDPRWQLPPITTIACDEQPTQNARALLAGFTGNHIDPNQCSIKLIRYTSPAEFVKDIRTTKPSLLGLASERMPSRLYAADAKSIRRFFERLDDHHADARVDMSKLPVGTFLINLHAALPTLANRDQLNLTRNHITNILASGYTGDDQLPPLLAVWNQVEPFFRNCEYDQDWLTQATHLVEIVAEVGRYGHIARTHTDIRRITLASQNIYRLVPWADISPQSAQRIHAAISNITSILATMADDQRIDVAKHFGLIQREITKGLQHVSAAERTQIMQNLQWFSSVEQRMYAESVIEAVGIVLGRAVTEYDEELEEERTPIRTLRHLDALSLQRTTHPIHIANLADGAFPMPRSSVGWPFRITQLPTEHHATALLHALDEQAYLVDLYHLWVALDGVDNQVTLSWIGEIAGELYNRSALLELLAIPEVRKDANAIKTVVGGIPTHTTQVASDTSEALPALAVHTLPSVDDDIAQSAWQQIPLVARASVELCQRRFALQWAMGATVSYTADFQHNILYGNLMGAGEQSRKFADPELVDRLWNFLTDGEKQSMIAHKAVGVGDDTRRGADYRWVYSLGGRSKNNPKASKEPTRPDLAYQVARGQITQDPLTIHKKHILPSGLKTHGRHICNMCPVKQRCAHFATEE